MVGTGRGLAVMMPPPSRLTKHVPVSCAAFLTAAVAPSTVVFRLPGRGFARRMILFPLLRHPPPAPCPPPFPSPLLAGRGRGTPVYLHVHRRRWCLTVAAWSVIRSRPLPHAPSSALRFLFPLPNRGLPTPSFPLSVSTATTPSPPPPISSWRLAPLLPPSRPHPPSRPLLPVLQGRPRRVAAPTGVRVTSRCGSPMPR